MAAMLRWIVLLMIALLPLRGWMGVAAAHEAGAGAAMAAQARADVPAHLSGTAAAAVPGHEDCMGHHAEIPSAGDDGTGDDGSFSCPTCSHCQACSGVGLAATGASLATASFDRARPVAAVARFASADRAPGFKPPIS
jgi:hypothetical protein